MQNKSWSDLLSSRALSDIISDGFLVVDESLTAIHSNSEFAALIGFSTDEIVGMPIKGLIKEDEPYIIDEVLPSIFAGETKRLEITWTTRTGDSVPTNVSAGGISASRECGTCIYLVISPVSGPLYESLILAQKTLRENEERYRLLYENLSDGVYTTNASGIITMCSDIGAEIFGYTREEMEGRNFGNLIHPEDLPIILETFRMSHEKGETIKGGIEARGIKKDGTVFHFHVTNTLLWEDGKPAGYQSLIRDVSARRLADEAVRASEQRYRNLFNNSPVSMWEEDFTAVREWMDSLRQEGVSDLESYLRENADAIKLALSLVKVIDVNARSVEMYEAESKKELMERLSDLFADDTYTGFAKELIAIWEGGPDLLQFESSSVTLKGKHLYTGITWKVQIIEGEMDLSRIVVAISDISHRIEFEEALKASEEKYRTIIQSMEDLVFVYDRDNRHAQYFAPDSSLLVSPPEEFLGKHIAEIFPDDLSKSFLSSFQRVRATKEAERMDYRLTIDGQERWFSASMTLHEDGESIVSVVRNITSRKQMEEELRESEERFAVFADNIPGPVFIKDKESNMLYANDYMKATFGKEEWIGKNTIDLFPGEQAEIMIRDDRKALMEGPLQVLQKVPDRNGDVHFYQTSKFPIVREEKPTLLGGIALDVTDRVHAEEAILASERRYRRLYESMEDGFVSADLDGRYLEFNAAYMQLAGYSEEELRNLTFWDLTPPQWHEMEKRIFRDQTLVKGHSDIYEKELLRKDGTIIPIELRIYLTRDDEGKPIGTWAIVRDISLRKRAEEALREERDAAQRYLDIARAAIVVVDVDGRIHLVNRKGLEIVGYEAHEIVGQTWFDVFSPPGMKEEERKSFTGFMRESQGLPGRHDRALINKRGEERLVSWEFQILTNEIGNAIGMIASGEDITDRNRAERALRESEEQYRSTLWALSDAIHVVDEDLNIILVNPQLTSWVRGLDLKSDIIGLRLSDAFPFLPDSVFEEYEEVFRTGKILTNEERVILAGHEIITETTKIPIMREGDVKQIVTIIRDVTEARKAGQAIMDSEAKYKQLVEQYTQGVAIVKGPPLDIVFANAALGRVLDIPADELVALAAEEVQALIHPDDLEKVMTRFSELMGGREADDEHFAVRFIRRSGEIRRVDILGRRVDYGGGHALQIAVADVTERFKAEEELRDSEERYRKLVEESLQGLAIIQDGRYVYANPSFARTLGSSVEEIVRFTPDEVWEHVYPEDREELHHRNRNINEEKAVSPRHRFRYIRDDGSIRWVESFVARVEYEGRPALQVLDVDITGRMLSEKALRESESKYRQLVEQSSLGIIIVEGLPLRIAFANETMAKISGFTVNELQSLSQEQIEAFIHPEDYEAIIDLLSATLSGKPPSEAPLVIRVIRSDGKMVWVEILGDRIEFQDRIAVQATVVDITERVNAEREKERAEQELKTAAETSMLYLDLLGHDMRNRLQAMQMAVELFQFDETRPHALSVLDRVLELIDSSEALIDKAHATRGLLSSPMEAVSLYDAVKDATNKMREKEEDVIIELECRTTDAQVVADEYIGHLLMNVLENA
ncbi:MAG: PAS domain S-box protein, partial [Candidatus Thorarchaeota archaeon]